MRVVFDTNVLISGFITTAGTAQHVLTMALKRHTIILSEYILGEMEHKLVTKLHIPDGEVKRTVAFLREKTLVLEISHPPKTSFHDKKDAPILALIEASKANYFVTGDKKLLGIRKVGPTVFVTPREAMEILENA